MKRILAGLSVILAIATGGCAASNASAEATRTSKMQALQSLLAAEEHVASLDDLNRIGSDMPDLLIRLAQDREQDIAYRARATSYLGYYQGNPKVEQFLSNLVTAPEPPAPMLRRGLTALARVSKGKAVSTITPHLKSADTLVREAAAQALLETDDAGAVQILHDAALQEREPFLKKKLSELAETADRKRALRPGAPKREGGEAQSTHP